MNWNEAHANATRVLILLSDACQHIEIAGSIRREKQHVKDIEIVCIPRMEPNGEDIFGEAMTSALNRTVAHLVAAGKLRFDEQTRRNGEDYKRFIHPPSGMAVDLFIAKPDNYGNILAIRTGCWEYSQALMIHAKRLGLRHDKGYLWCGDMLIPCYSEQAFFTELGLVWVHPRERTPEAAEKLWRKQ